MRRSLPAEQRHFLLAILDPTLAGASQDPATQERVASESSNMPGSASAALPFRVPFEFSCALPKRGSSHAIISLKFSSLPIFMTLPNVEWQRRDRLLAQMRTNAQ